MVCVDTKLTDKCQPGGMVRRACCCSHNHQPRLLNYKSLINGCMSTLQVWGAVCSKIQDRCIYNKSTVNILNRPSIS